MMIQKTFRTLVVALAKWLNPWQEVSCNSWIMLGPSPILSVFCPRDHDLKDYYDDYENYYQRFSAIFLCAFFIRPVYNKKINYILIFDPCISVLFSYPSTVKITIWDLRINQYQFIKFNRLSFQLGKEAKESQLTICYDIFLCAVAIFGTNYGILVTFYVDLYDIDLNICEIMPTVETTYNNGLFIERSIIKDF